MADNESIRQLAAALVEAMTRTGKSVSTAESCTGGWIAKAITDIPGSSAVFHYGIVSYSNAAKEQLLGVKHDTLERHGAVSEPVVEEMAAGAIRMSGADIAVAVSGIAGPDGGTEQKPVGTVWFAWAANDAKKTRIETRERHFRGDRERIREATVAQALQGVIDRL